MERGRKGYACDRAALQFATYSRPGYDFSGWTVVSAPGLFDVPSPAELFSVPKGVREELCLTALEYVIDYKLQGRANFPDNPARYDENMLNLTLGGGFAGRFVFLNCTLNDMDSDFNDELEAPERRCVITKGTTGHLRFVAQWEAEPDSSGGNGRGRGGSTYPWIRDGN